MGSGGGGGGGEGGRGVEGGVGGEGGIDLILQGLLLSFPCMKWLSRTLSKSFHRSDGHRASLGHVSQSSSSSSP